MSIYPCIHLFFYLYLNYFYSHILHAFPSNQKSPHNIFLSSKTLNDVNQFYNFFNPKAAVDIILKIHKKNEDGHILVFLTGQEEIETVSTTMRTYSK